MKDEIQLIKFLNIEKVYPKIFWFIGLNCWSYLSKNKVQGCYCWQISPDLKKVHVFKSVFSLKWISRQKTVFNSLETLKIYCEIVLNVFPIIIFNNNKNQFIHMIDFLF